MTSGKRTEREVGPGILRSYAALPVRPPEIGQLLLDAADAWEEDATKIEQDESTIEELTFERDTIQGSLAEAYDMIQRLATALEDIKEITRRAAVPTTDEDRSAGRWCAKCQRHGSHHTAQHDALYGKGVVENPG